MKNSPTRQTLWVFKKNQIQYLTFSIPDKGLSNCPVSDAEGFKSIELKIRGITRFSLFQLSANTLLIFGGEKLESADESDKSLFMDVSCKDKPIIRGGPKLPRGAIP